MTPLDDFRLWFAGLDSDLQYEIAFALVPALVDHGRELRFKCERDFIAALEAWLAPTRFSPRTIARAKKATSLIDAAFNEGGSPEGKAVWDRIKGEWQALKRERIGKEAIAERSVAIRAEKLKAVVPAAPGSRAASQH